MKTRRRDEVAGHHLRPHYLLDMFALAAASCGFTPMPSGVVPRIATTRAPIVSMSMESRRAALLGLAAAASTVAVPAFADSIEEIAARNAAAAAKEREAKAAQADGVFEALSS